MAKEIKDFSPICFESKRIIWNEKETREIDSIKETFSFNPDFDLHEHLSRFDTEIKTLKAYERQTPTERNHRFVKII